MKIVNRSITDRVDSEKVDIVYDGEITAFVTSRK